MKKQTIFLCGLILLTVLILLAAWEFVLEDFIRYLLGYSVYGTTAQHLEGVIVGIAVVIIALIIPLKHVYEAVKKQRETEQTLRFAKEKAEEASLLKDKFISLVSHDLRSPLASIIGLMRVINADVVHPLSEDQKALLQHMMKTGDGLVHMIDKLLDIGKLKTGVIKPNSKFIDSRHIAAQAIGAVSHIASDKGITLFNEVPEEHKIFADPDLFLQVLHNLVSNAVKFSDRDDIVMVFVPEGRPNTMAVRDTGVGVSDGDIGRVFRHDEKTTTVGTAGESGTGLGLPLSADIMIAHGGSLTVESEPGKGSVFYAEAPVVRPLILLVEEDKAARKWFARLLKGLDVNVIETGSGDEALAIMTEARPHLVITDTMAPVVDGRDLLQSLKQRRETKDIPVMAIVSEDEPLSKEKAEMIGADDIVEKNISSQEFMAKVKGLLNAPGYDIVSSGDMPAGVSSTVPQEEGFLSYRKANVS